MTESPCSPMSYAERDWLQAEAELTARRALRAAG